MHDNLGPLKPYDLAYLLTEEVLPAFSSFALMQSRSDPLS